MTPTRPAWPRPAPRPRPKGHDASLHEAHAAPHAAGLSVGLGRGLRACASDPAPRAGAGELRRQARSGELRGNRLRPAGGLLRKVSRPGHRQRGYPPRSRGHAGASSAPRSAFPITDRMLSWSPGPKPYRRRHGGRIGITPCIVPPGSPRPRATCRPSRRIMPIFMPAPCRFMKLWRHARSGLDDDRAFCKLAPHPTGEDR
jgi:hypothetical protein